jgi:hypothetical protein
MDSYTLEGLVEAVMASWYLLPAWGIQARYHGYLRAVLATSFPSFVIW